MINDVNFKNDDYVKVFPAGDGAAQIDFLECINDAEKETVWVEFPLADSQVKTIARGPLFASQLLEEYEIYGNNLDAVLSTITDGSEMGYAEGSQFMVKPSVEEGEKEKPYYLLSKPAKNDLVGITGSACTAFFRRPLDRQESELQYDLSLVPAKKKAKARISKSACKILDLHGEVYTVLRANKMLYGITDIFDKKYKGYEFKGGMYTHTGVSATWAFPDQAEEILELYEDSISKKAPALSFADATPVVKFYTSDSGDSCASLHAYLEKDNAYRMKIGNIVKVYHKGNVSENDIINAAESVFAKFRDLVEAMSKLVEIEIKNPIPCMLNAGAGEKSCNLNKAHLLRAIEEFKDMYGDEPEGITANDVFYVLQRALYNMRLDEKIGEAKVEDCEESLLRMLSPTFSWESYDSPILTVN